MTADSTATAPRSPCVRSRLGNGTRAFQSADGRSAGARLLRDREHDFAAPLGGLAGLSPAERSRVSAAASLSVRMEQIRSAIARGEADGCDESLVRLSNALARELNALDRLAAARKAAVAKPTLSEHLARTYGSRPPTEPESVAS